MSNEAPLHIDLPDGSHLEAVPSEPTVRDASDYPGIWVKHVLKNGSEAASALLEYDPTEQRLMLRVWGYDRPGEDPILYAPLSPRFETEV